MKYGYARISTGKQNTDRQVEELKKYDLHKIYIDKINGSNFDRPEFDKLINDVLRKGDELYMEEINHKL